MKKCNKCGIEKELSEFYKEKNYKDGLHSSCKICHNTRARKWFKENRKRSLKVKSKYNRTIEGKYAMLRGAAKQRGLELRISLEEYVEILKENKCHYCDASLLGSAGHSLNRVDSDKGYLVNNVMPCCKFCNRIMSDFTKEELKTRVYKIIKRMR